MSLPKILILNLLLAAAYFITAKFGFLLALPPGNVSPLWPPSGIAVAALMLYGPRLFPGVLLGSALVNWQSMSGDSAWWVASLIAAGSTLQSLVAAQILRYLLPRSNVETRDEALVTPDCARSVFLFVLICGFAAAFAPSVGVGALVLGGYAPVAMFAKLWWTWWLGDYAGILILTPVLLVLGSKWRGSQLKDPWLFAFTTFWLGLSLISFFVALQLERQTAHQQLERRLDNVQNQLSLVLHRVEISLTALGGLFDASTQVDAEEYSAFVLPLLKKSPDILAAVWAPLVLGKDRQQWLANTAAKTGIKAIRERNSRNELIEVGERAEYFPVLYLEPLDNNRALFGFDLGAEVERHEAIRKARDNASIAITAPLMLIQTLSGSKEGLVFIHPVYSALEARESAASRDQIRGVAVMVLPTDKLFEDIWSPLQQSGFALRISDISKTPTALMPSQNFGSDDDIISAKREVYGRYWLLELGVAAVGPLSTFGSWRAWILLLFGLAMSAIMTAYIDIRRHALDKVLRAESRARQIFESSPDAMLVVAEDGHIIEANAAASALFDYEHEQLSRMNVDELVPSASLDAHQLQRAEFTAAARKGAQGLARQVSAKRRHGELIPVDIALSPLHEADKTQVIAVARDISARVRAQQEIHDLNDSLEQRVAERTHELQKQISEREQAQQDLQQAQQELQHTVAVLEDKQREISLLREFGEVLESSDGQEDMLVAMNHFLPYLFENTAGGFYMRHSGHWQRELVWGAHEDELPAQFSDTDCWALKRGRLYMRTLDHGLECPHVADRPAGVDAPHQYLCTPVSCDNQTLGLLHIRAPAGGSLHESLAGSVSERIGLLLSNLRLRESLREQAFHDSLTQAFNRRYLLDALPRELQRALRNSTQLAVVLLDVDHFKRFNDEHGHAAGDKVLIEVARSLRENLRVTDLVCRYGGEEFVLLLPESEQEGAYARLEELRQQMLRMKVRHEGKELPPITSSFGLAIYPEHGSNADELLMVADKALYRAKSEGRNRVCVAETDKAPN